MRVSTICRYARSARTTCSSPVSSRGLAARPGSCRGIAGRGQDPRKWGYRMRVLLATYGSRGDVEPLAGLAVRLRALDAEVQMFAPPDKEFAELMAGVGVPLVPLGPPIRSMVRPS